MTTVVFDPVAFAAQYPEFASTATPRMQSMFDLAQYTLLDNTSGSPVMDIGFRTQLFNMIVGHLLLLYGQAPTVRPDGTVDNTPPGRITSATEGSVTSSFQLEVTNQNGSAPWWNQTKYGALYWAATARFRSFRYAVSGGSGAGYAKAYGVLPVNLPGGV
jgi:hypothetical protein